MNEKIIKNKDIIKGDQLYFIKKSLIFYNVIVIKKKKKYDF